MSTLVGPTASAAAWTGYLGFGALSVSPVLSHGCRSPRSPDPLSLLVPEYRILSLVPCSIVERTSRRSYRSFQPSPLSRFDRHLCTGRPRGLDGTFILTATLQQLRRPMALLGFAAVLRVSRVGRPRCCCHTDRGGGIASSLVQCFVRRAYVASIGTFAPTAPSQSLRSQPLNDRRCGPMALPYSTASPQHLRRPRWPSLGSSLFCA